MFIQLKRKIYNYKRSTIFSQTVPAQFRLCSIKKAQDAFLTLRAAPARAKFCVLKSFTVFLHFAVSSILSV